MALKLCLKIAGFRLKRMTLNIIIEILFKTQQIFSQYMQWLRNRKRITIEYCSSWIIGPPTSYIIHEALKATRSCTLIKQNDENLANWYNRRRFYLTNHILINKNINFSCLWKQESANFNTQISHWIDYLQK